MIKRAYRKPWILRRLQNLGANRDELKLIYQQQVRNVLEFSTPVWAGAVTQEDIIQIERVQRCAFRIVLGYAYESHHNAIHTFQMDSLEVRQTHICLRFAKQNKLT